MYFDRMIDESNGFYSSLCDNEGSFGKSLCEKLDAEDQLQRFRAEFLFPHTGRNCSRENSIYLCGNSLGLQPKRVKKYVEGHLLKWQEQGVHGHFSDDISHPWLTVDDTVQSSSALLVGAQTHEVVIMNSLTCNLHLMMLAFYKPTSSRHKIIIEKKSFPSDYYAVESQIIHYGYSPSISLIEVSPGEGKLLLHMDDIESILRLHGESTALVLFSGVQYYTGQLFDIEKITKIAHSFGCVVGFDLAHAVGNVPLLLHDWGVDFACWCSYKYLNAGPGAIAGCFVHERHMTAREDIISDLETKGDDGRAIGKGLAGWWGHRLEDRFQMGTEFHPCEGAYRYRLSNPPVLMVACLRASLDLFDEAGMDRLRAKSIQLTAYLEWLIVNILPENTVRIFTPSDPSQRGCQLSLSFINGGVEVIHEALENQGVICDVRKPDVMRVAPTPLYNSFNDVYRFVYILKDILLEIKISNRNDEMIS